jgi:Niemann-Pick C1 protein
MDQTAVKSVDFYVSDHFGEGFYNSCKSIQVGSTNGYAMDLIGGGAKDYHGFFQFMGDVKDMGSPFQINFPQETPTQMTPFNADPRNCADNDLGSRCTCIDCPSICQELPAILPPGSEPACHVGAITCLSFALTLVYGLAILAFIVGYVVPVTIRRRREKRVGLSADGASDITPLSPRSHSRGLVGASSLARPDGEESSGQYSESRRLGRGASLLDPLDTAQPRQYRLDAFLRRTFYRIGMLAASHPWMTFAVMFAFMALLNMGWNNFEFETDPVRLWVAPDSESRLRKEYFDQHFGPFYRPQQIYVTKASPVQAGRDTNHSLALLTLEEKPPVLSWETLRYWFEIESEIRELRSSPHGYTLSDICFKPLGPDGACVVQSVAGWFDNSLDAYDPSTWQDHLLACAKSPVECRPDFEQPLAPQYVLGGIPEAADESKRYLDSQALVITIVVSDSLDKDVQNRAMEWERTLRAYLMDLSERIPREAGLEIAFSTGVSLEEEINKSTNTDVKIVVLSYLAMFFYVSLTLGNGFSSQDEKGASASLAGWARNFPKLFSRAGSSTDSVDTPRVFPRLPRRLFIGSKVVLGLFAISLVILSVSSSVGFFSILGVKATLIIAEVIPFLVLAVGVDNVFILVHEMDRQNILHGPNASATATYGPNTPLSPTQSRARLQFDASQSHDDSVDERSVHHDLSVEERVARTLAKMGPSILLSTITEFVAFILGAIVPMPAVRNFALYAAGSVLLNALLQITVFISALALDQRRVEVGHV